MWPRLDPPRFGFEPYHPFGQLGCHMHPRLKDRFGRAEAVETDRRMPAQPPSNAEPLG